jgi:hypothetical protein
MAFTGRQAGEVLQLLGRDVRPDGGVWVFDVNEIGDGKSLKTGHRRHVPIHKALVDGGFQTFAQPMAPDAPLFPDKPSIGSAIAAVEPGMSSVDGRGRQPGLLIP